MGWKHNGRRWVRTANCNCDGSVLVKRQRWVVLVRAGSLEDPSELKCLDCTFRWSSKRLYVAKLPDWVERSRNGMTDFDILERLNNGSLRACLDSGRIESFRHGKWNRVTEVFREDVRKDNGSGYYFVKICYKGKQKKIAVHRLVWMAAHREVVPDGIHVDHIEGKEAGNGIENLQLLTQGENCRRGAEKGRGVLAEF